MARPKSETKPEFKEDIVDNIQDEIQETITKEEVKPKVEVNLNDRVLLDNLCDWELHFRGIESDKDLFIPASVKSHRLLTVAEVFAQVRQGNIYFAGTDGFGTNASVKIIDENQARYIYEDNIPTILDINAVKKLLLIDNREKFENELSKLVVTSAEKRMIVSLARECGIDNCPSYMMVAIEKISGYKFD
jgi:hypothetical protein